MRVCGSLLVALCAIAGCSSPSTETQTEVVGVDSTESAEIRPETTQTLIMPLDEFFGSPTDIDAYAAELNSLLRKRTDSITECVRSDGFDFFTEPAEIRRPQGFQYGSRTDVLTAELYGVSAGIDSFRSQRVEVADVVDKNEDGLDSLSPEQLQAFNQTYDSCFDEAYERFTEPAFSDVLPNEVAEEASRARLDMANDPGFAAIWSEWSRCIREAGYDYATRAKIRRTLVADADLLTQQLYLLPYDQSPNETLLAGLDELRATETAIMQADVDCADGIDLDRRLIALQFELETEILVEHGDRWTLLRAASDD